jgi:hypothetical protein
MNVCVVLCYQSCCVISGAIEAELVNSRFRSDSKMDDLDDHRDGDGFVISKMNVAQVVLRNRSDIGRWRPSDNCEQMCGGILHSLTFGPGV